MKTTLPLVMIAALAGIGYAAQQGGLQASVPAAQPVAVGDVTPSWSVSDSAGKTQAIDSYRGKYVVLEWTNKDCPFVKKHYGSGNMQATQAKAKEMGAVWLSVISSAPGNQGYMSAEQVNSYRADMKVKSAATLLDSEGKLGKMYGAKTTPQIVIIDPKGKLIYNGAIDDKATPDPADIAGSKNYALAALSEAMAGKPVTFAQTKSYGCSVKY